MLLSLLRVLRCRGGIIAIDGCDIARVPLRRLRSSLAVIPQDPVQVASNVREAIDPFGEYSDTQVLAIMREVGLTHTQDDERGEPQPHREDGAGAQACSHVAAGNTLHLQTDLKEGGANLSVGQRQLLCLARALLAQVRCEAGVASSPDTDLDGS